MNRISWCKKQDKGIKFTEPNNNLSSEYFRNAEESLLVLRSVMNTKSNMWIATVRYYAEYFAFYSILMKIGVKCEIHDCTIQLAKFLEDEGVVKGGTFGVLNADKELRIDNQYYLKNKAVEVDFEKISGFMISIKESMDNLTVDRISEIRRKLKNVI